MGLHQLVSEGFANLREALILADTGRTAAPRVKRHYCATPAVGDNGYISGVSCLNVCIIFSVLVKSQSLESLIVGAPVSNCGGKMGPGP